MDAVNAVTVEIKCKHGQDFVRIESFPDDRETVIVRVNDDVGVLVDLELLRAVLERM